MYYKFQYYIVKIKFIFIGVSVKFHLLSFVSGTVLALLVLGLYGNYIDKDVRTAIALNESLEKTISLQNVMLNNRIDIHELISSNDLTANKKSRLMELWARDHELLIELSTHHLNTNSTQPLSMQLNERASRQTLRRWSNQMSGKNKAKVDK